jgi:hypothetical protein
VFLLALFGVVTVALVGIALALVTGRSPVSNEVAGALAGAAVAGLASLGVGVLGYVERRRALEEAERIRDLDYAERAHERITSNVFSALSHFAGKTQDRSIGIAVVEGSWAEVPEFHPVLVPLLANQVIYLLSESGQEDKAHEVDNLRRMIDLLVEGNAEPTMRTPFARASYDAVRSALTAAIAKTSGGGIGTSTTAQKTVRGLEVPVVTLIKWKDALQVADGPGSA